MRCDGTRVRGATVQCDGSQSLTSAILCWCRRSLSTTLPPSAAAGPVSKTSCAGSLVLPAAWPAESIAMTIGVLASHEGSTLQSLLDACAQEQIAGRIAVVISNNGRSGALARARHAGVLGLHLSSHSHPDPEALDIAIRDVLVEAKVDLVLLAGYMKRLGPHVLAAFRGRILNTHPALLPKFGGKGMYGDRVFEAVLSDDLHVVPPEDRQPMDRDVLACESQPLYSGDLHTAHWRCGPTRYAVDEFGFVLPLVIGATAVRFWSRREVALAAWRQSL